MSERDVFIAALQIEDPAGRSAYLDGACGPDADLRRRVETLLQAFGQAGSFLQRPAADPAATSEVPPAEGPGTLVGPYKLLQQIGEGGMGTVFLAQQTQPVQRKVALKVIKPGMDSRQVVARFEAERQALALMDHVNIARVFDGGTTDNGRPYFVMELVNGVPITRYCDDNQLGPRERLELFVPVCQAIQHAHQKGIIHRDVKPSNVLVTLYDGRPVPKVIDFGVAKATEQRLTERTLFTQFGAVVGTLEYMSPEQAEMSALGIDTRSDIYSLGVLLYELLTGSTPLTHKRLKEAAYAEVLRMIKEEEPPRPSTRLSDSGEALASISARRHMEPGKLTRLVKGELDWIVMRSLEKDRNRRYETASGFAADVQRYLNDEPVQACPPSAWYRFSKFARRNKRILASVTVMALAVLVAVVALAISNVLIRRESTEKAQALKDKDEALQDAKSKTALAREAQGEAVESLKDALAAVDQMLTQVAAERLINVPQMEPIRKDLLQDALKFYQKFLQKKSGDPLIRRETALAYWRVGKIHHVLGRSAEAEAGYSTAIAMFKEADAESPLEAGLRRELVGIHLEFSWVLNDRGKSEGYEPNVRRAVQIAEELVKEFPHDLCYGLLLANASNQLSDLIAQTRPQEAETRLRRNLSLINDLTAQPRPREAEKDSGRRAILINESRIVGVIYEGLGSLAAAQGRNAEAETNYREALKHAEKGASDHPDANWLQGACANSLQQLARIVATNGRPTEADGLRRRAISILAKSAATFSAGPYHRDCLARAYLEHADLLKELKRSAEAEEAYRQALAVYDQLATDFRARPGYQQQALDRRFLLGQYLTAAGRAQDAVDAYGPAIDAVDKLSADAPTKLKHWQSLVRIHMELARLLGAAGKTQHAEAAYGQVVAIQERLEAAVGGKPEFRREVISSHLQAADLLRAARHLQGAEKLYRRAVEQSERLLADSPSVAEPSKLLDNALTAFQDFLHANGQIQERERFWRDRVNRYAKLAIDFPKVPAFRFELARSHCLLTFTLSLKLVADFPDRKDYRDRLFESCFRLAHLLNDTGRPNEVERPYREIMTLYKTLADKFPLAPEHRASSVHIQWHMCHMLKAAGRLQDAGKCLRENLAMSVQLVTDFPAAAEYHEHLCRSRSALMDFFSSTNRLKEAVQPCHEVLTLYSNLAARFPGVPKYRASLFESHLLLHELWAATDQLQEADQTYRALLKLAGNDAALCEEVAWALVTRTDHAKVYKASRAVEAAKKAVALAPQEGPYWSTLGIAHYRTGDWKAARAALEKSADLGYARGSNLFFLAMAHWQLGGEKEALRRYDQAVGCMERFAPGSKDLRRFRDEASLVLFVRLLATLSGHGSDVRSLEFAPDGKTLATGSFDWTVKCWDVATAKERATLRGHTSIVNCVTFTRDGKKLATAGYLDPTIKVWDASSRKEVAAFPAHPAGVQWLAFAPDGKTLASCGRGDFLVKVWDVAGGKEVVALKGHSKLIECVAFAPNGETLASGGEDGQLRLWRVATWNECGPTLPGPHIRSIAFSPDSKTFALGCTSGTVHLGDATTGKERLVMRGLSNWVHAVAFSPDGNTVASGDMGGTVRLWDPRTGRELASIEAHSRGVRTVAFSPDGKTLASGSRDPAVKLWDVSRVTSVPRR